MAADWSQISNIPADLADGVDSDAAGATTGEFSDLNNIPADADTLGSLSCADGEVAKFNQTSGAWECATDETQRQWCYVCYPNGFDNTSATWTNLPSFNTCNMTTGGGPVRVQMEYSMYISTNHGGLRLVMDQGQPTETVYGNQGTYGLDWQSHHPGEWIKRSITRVLTVPAGSHTFMVQTRAQSNGQRTYIHGGDCDQEYSGFHIFMEELD